MTRSSSSSSGSIFESKKTSFEIHFIDTFTKINEMAIHKGLTSYDFPVALIEGRTMRGYVCPIVGSLCHVVVLYVYSRIVVSVRGSVSL